MAGTAADSAGLIDRCELAGFEVDAKGADAAAFFAIGGGDIANRVEILF